jgi:hypothetical protein
MPANANGADRATAGADLSVSPNDRKLRQLVLTLVAQLAEAQFVRADQPRVERLWREVAALEIDPERIIRLLYGGHDLNDRDALAAMDRTWAGAGGRSGAHGPARRGPGQPWLRRPWPGGGRRNAPPAALPARH